MHAAVVSVFSVHVQPAERPLARSSHARYCSSRPAVAVGLAAPANSAPSGAGTTAKGVEVPESAPTVGLPTIPDPGVPLRLNPPMGDAFGPDRRFGPCVVGERGGIPADDFSGMFHVMLGRAGGSAAGRVVATAGGPRVASKMACHECFHGQTVARWSAGTVALTRAPPFTAARRVGRP